jgi:hypothetical protein
MSQPEIDELLQADCQPVIVQIVTNENLDKFIEETEHHNEQSH